MRIYASDVKLTLKKNDSFLVISDLNFNLSTSFIKGENTKNQFFIVYSATLINRDESLNLSVSYNAVFATQEAVTQETLSSEIVKINATVVGFPYLRAFITQFSVLSGISPIILPTINFTKLKK